ncbi:hypothetical protein F2Q70_00030859 [Brassica cretica]|uniref:DUF569 domain-containing protein n=1 Tax=Brassica cretica TaxID=69181 RepID=A0A8S9FB82_BRACR|nr:hypothetical protein F2Q70_00030859 [Brassica cretica]
MELFSKANAVKLLGHHGMFLFADDDLKTIRQSPKGYSRLAIWTVETIVGEPKLIRLRSCHGTYLTASSKPFLLGMTGEKVTQTQSPNNPMDCQTQWEPMGDGVSVKLKSWCGKWMRANGGTPPWRKSVTHDEPPTSKTKNWLRWYVITIDGFDLENMSDGYKSALSSPISPHLPSLGFWSAPGSPVSGRPKKSLGRFASFGLRSMSPRWSPKLNMSIFKQKEKTCSFNEKETVSAVEFFRKAKAIRMRSSHNKYLTADEDEETVTQGKNGSTENAQWTVEPVRHSYHVIRLKSCYGKYLTASNERFLLGATGKKVMQLKPSRLDSSVEWEPVREGSKILLKTRYGTYLRANDGPPPRRKSVTHDNSHSATLESISWEVDVVEILINPQFMEEMEFTPSPRRSLSPPPYRKPSNFRLSMTPSSLSCISNSESDESPAKPDGQTIDYHINPPFKEEMKFTASSKNTLPSPHRKPSWNPFSLSDKSDSDSDVSLPKSNEISNNYHIDLPFNAEIQSTMSSKKTMYPSPHRKLSDSLHSNTLSSLLDISDSYSETQSDSDGRTLEYHTDLPSKEEMKFIPSSKKMPHPTQHKKPSNYPHPKTSSYDSDKSDSDCDEYPSRSDGQTINYHSNPPFKAEMKSTPSSKEKLHASPNRKMSISIHSKTPSSLSDISDSNSDCDESPSKSDGRTIDHHINPPFKTAMKSTPSLKRTVHPSPHRKLSNSPHLETSSSISEKSDSDCDESPSKSYGRTIDYHINPPFKTTMKSTPSLKKTLNPTPHRKLLNCPHLKTPSSVSDISDSDCDESPSKSDWRTIDFHIDLPFKVEMKSTSSSKKMLYRKSTLSDKSDSESDESPSKLDGQTVDFHINPPYKLAMNFISSSKKMLHLTPHKKKPSNNFFLFCQSVELPLKPDGRTIYYSIADKRHMEEISSAGYVFTFKGNSVAELTQTLREETCLEDVVVCTRNPLSGKLSPLRLQLPPNNGTLHVVLLPSSAIYERRENQF